ncbi:hypothetical protein QFZ42_000816 [Variovorax paradoxus]|uniref:Pycsar system effector family protein n=1 Tax=Variovorax paradoxus TaxID=34073 RepID=UPI0027922D0F|nr:Pycsar system effector family protein [Variovorax paradoxus]MDQ0568982.1 hypothetical protein [Variovorax paradoxus]
MNTVEQKVLSAQWNLERQLFWVSQSEIKIGVLVTMDLGMFAGLAASFASTKMHLPWAIVFTAGCIALLMAGLLFSAMCLMPRVKAPHDSMLFFGKVARRDADAYVAQFKTATAEQLLDDWLYQVHTNAKIAEAKHTWVRRAMFASFGGAACWLPAVWLMAEF